MEAQNLAWLRQPRHSSKTTSQVRICRGRLKTPDCNIWGDAMEVEGLVHTQSWTNLKHNEALERAFLDAPDQGARG